MDFEAHRVDAMAVDPHLLDAGTVGPELAHLSGVYLRSPRALSWRSPSPEWRLFVLLLPLASRMSLLVNPIFAQLTRAWGLNVRFVGVDRDGLVHDFRSLLTDGTLRLLVRTLDAGLSDDRPLLDTLFAALAADVLNLVGQRHTGWGRHLDVEHRLESLQPSSLFDRDTRHPDFLAQLRAALRDELIDASLYGRALRAVDAREAAVEARIATRIQSTLDRETLDRVVQSGVGHHLGSYNWLLLGGRHTSHRAHVLGRLPGLATWFAETLVPLDASRLDSGPHAGADLEDEADETASGPTLDLRAVTASAGSAHNRHWARVLRRAIDAGQDRAVIEALAQRFAVGDNLIRRLWHAFPAGLGQLPGWHLERVLRELDRLTDRAWPADEAQWQALAARAAPGATR